MESGYVAMVNSVVMVTSVVMSHSKFYLMLTRVARFLIATVGRQIPSSTCFLMETLNFEKISGYLQQNVSIPKSEPHCFTN